MAEEDKPVVALLVEPVAGDRGFAKSWKPRGNGRPPLAWKGPMGWDVSGPPYLQRMALPLWWDGAVVGMGWDIARRYLLEHAPEAHRAGVDAVLHTMWPTLTDCRSIARALVTAGIAVRFVELVQDPAAGLIEVEVPAPG